MGIFVIEYKIKLVNKMSEDHKKQLEQQLWNIANTLRGKMNCCRKCFAKY
jgi:hypothetical protein